ncbi:MAG TPA: CusA/CzcA family heavy metal efflux RND transporter [Acidobacteriota bacterium]|nr:CusA/CzcA family heavy metal efflux RND transporter [Acidobacteriota bacterium]
MRRLIDISLNNRFLVLVLVGLVVAVGVRAMLQLPIDAVPDVTPNQVQVLTNAPGLGPLEVERFITFPVETAMSGLPGIVRLRSVSRFGLSAVTVYFEEGMDIYFCRRLVMERLPQAREAIPGGFGTPEMGPISTGLGEVFQFEVRGQGYSLMELRSILDWDIAYKLRSVPGVVEVNSFGGELKTYEVQVDADALVSHAIPLKQVFRALESNNANAGGAYLVKNQEQQLIRGEGLIEGLDQIGDIVVSTSQDGTPIYVRNIARVAFAPMVRQGAVTRDGRGEAVTGVVMMLIGENSRTVVNRVRERVEEIRQSLPPGVVIDTYYDRTELVRDTIGTVITNLSEGGALVILVLLLLLGSFKGGLIVASAIPLSMLFAFICMGEFGISGNLMSLGAIDFGLVVDGSVVMIENIMRHLQSSGKAGCRLETVRRAAREVGRPVAFAIGIIIIVYLPVLTLQGVEGKMFRPMALTVVFALAGSLILALTFMPVAASMVLKPGSHEQETWLIRQAKRIYKPFLGKTIATPRLTALAAFGLFAVSLLLVPFLGAEFIPRLDEGAVALQAWRLPSVSLEESIHSTTMIESVLLEEFPEVETVVSRTGRPEIATDPMGVEISDIYAILRPPSQWVSASSKAELVSKMDEALKARVPGNLYSYSQPIELRVQELIAGVRSDVAIQIFGEDLETLERLGGQIVAAVREVPGAADVKAEQVAGLPYLRILIDRKAIARYGINISEVLDVVRAVGGRVTGQVLEGQRRFHLQVRFQQDQRDRASQLNDLKIADSRGRLIPLSQVASLITEEGPAQISREDIHRRLAVEANVRGRDLAGFVSDAQQAVARSVELPSGYWLQWGGQFENLQRASARLALVVPAALFLIFVLLYTTFGSVRLAGLIYINVPIAATGGIVALFAREMPFSISAGVGFIALFGIAVLNGVVLVSCINQFREEGLGAREAARQGALTRLRPVLMTALVASLGFLPMALSTSAGAEVQRPLATVVIGGLVTSTLLTLLVLPAIYGWIAEGKPAPEREGKSDA